MRIILLTILVVLALPVSANEPEETLDAYFDILTTRTYNDIGNLMATDSMENLKSLMDKALIAERQRKGTMLQARIYGEGVTEERISKTTANEYLALLAGEILLAADNSRFFIDNRKVLGKIEEGDDLVHFVSRLYMHQMDEDASDIYVYTLVREGEDWKLTFPPTIRQMLTLIERTVPTK